MVAQWTEEDPGVGATGPLVTLSGLLESAAIALDSGRLDTERTLAIFPDMWAGLSAAAATGRITALKAQAGELMGAAESVKKALRVYSDELDEIQPLASDQGFFRDSAQRRVQALTADLRRIAEATQRQKLTAELRDAEASEKAALDALSELAKRRQAADDAILVSVRAAIAEYWNVPPEAWPNERSGGQQGSYQYDMKHPLGVKSSEYTAKELMDVFKKHPKEIFPFAVKGIAAEFEDGAIFELSNTLGDGIHLDVEAGEVLVSTTDTSVKFTVVSDGYFDGPGSTIEFSVVEENGELYLRKVAAAEKVHNVVDTSIALAEGFWFVPGPEGTWARQAENFKKVIHEYGG